MCKHIGLHLIVMGKPLDTCGGGNYLWQSALPRSIVNIYTQCPHIVGGRPTLNGVN